MVKNLKVLLYTLLSFLFIFNISHASNFESYYIEKDLYEDDSIIIEGQNGDRYLVEYGVGCLSIWRYEWKNIYIDIGGTFLDGIGDTIHLPDSDGSCRVWDVVELDPSYDQIELEQAIETLCGENALIDPEDGMCFCKVGYQLNDSQDGCIQQEIPPANLRQVEKSENEICESDFGLFSKWNGEVNADESIQCICTEGYEWSTNGDSCIKIQGPVESEIEKQNDSTFSQNQKSNFKDKIIDFFTDIFFDIEKQIKRFF